MSLIDLEFGQPESWSSHGSVHVRGSAFLENRLLEASALAQMIAEMRDYRAIVELIKRCNGYFAVIVNRDDFSLLAVDKLRSIPLFFCRDKRVKASDVAEHLDFARGRIILATPFEEFRLVGYTLGNRTLSPEVYQVCAGQVAIVRPNGEDASVLIETYWKYRNTASQDISDAHLTEQLHETLHDSFGRLEAYLNGRQAVVPLSGGYDSRLVLSMLKERKYTDVVAFSYGQPGNRESEVSRQVAERLGVRWEFVPYSKEEWRGWFESQERRDYFRRAHNLVSTPHVMDWPAVGQLKRNGLVSPTAVFVPGHSGDLLSGSRSAHARVLYRDEPPDRNVLLHELIRYHAHLFAMPSDPAALHRLHASFNDSLGELRDFRDNAGAFEAWDVRERQSKYIVNSMRVYEYWGFDWWLPLWDEAFVDFWSTVPIRARLDQHLYKQFVASLYGGLTNQSVKDASVREKSRWRSRIDWLAKGSPIALMARSAARVLRRHHGDHYSKHPMAWYGIMDEPTFSCLFTGREKIVSFLALYMLYTLRNGHLQTPEYRWKHDGEPDLMFE